MTFCPAGGTIDEARLLAGRALAWEGIYEWNSALQDYNDALARAAAVDKRPDPYVLNSRGNVRASLGDWAGECRCDRHMVVGSKPNKPCIKKRPIPLHSEQPRQCVHLANWAGLLEVRSDSQVLRDAVLLLAAPQCVYRSACRRRSTLDHGMFDKDGSQMCRRQRGLPHGARWLPAASLTLSARVIFCKLCSSIQSVLRLGFTSRRCSG